jgi:hypothetical protein
VAKIIQGLKDKMPKKKLILAYRILSFHFSKILVYACGFAEYPLQCDGLDINMKDINFFKKVYKFHGIGILGEAPLKK